MKFCVYIIYSPSIDKYYVGHTENLNKRIEEHRLKKNLGANDWLLKYSETFFTRSEAMVREVEIKKKKRRTYLEWLIKTNI
jgi:putative endonuclease